MPAEDTPRLDAPPRRVEGETRKPHQPPATSRGFLVVHPRHRAEFERLGLTTPGAVIDLPGEVVSGHPSRHVMQVHLPSQNGPPRIAYLKRQHVVSWKERLRNALAGFGCVSRSVREAILLAQLEAEGHPAPHWLAYGETGDGRAFLLVADVPGVLDLRAYLSDPHTPAEDRRRCAERVGQVLAELHAAGFHHPDATAKHVLVDPRTLAITLLDWQSARRQRVSERDRTRTLAALHASLAEAQASPGERARFLWAYRRVAHRAGHAGLPSFAAWARRIQRAAKKLGRRRSIRDQKQVAPQFTPQRLVWLAGEAACVVPDLAPAWPCPADGTPFYGPTSHTAGPIRFADGTCGRLVRGRSFAPFARLRARLRGKPWRSPELKLARLFFHLDRYGVPAPRLLAFGQKLAARGRSESFLVYEPPSRSLPFEEWACRGVSEDTRTRVLEAAGHVLRLLHDSGCRFDGPLADEPLFHVVSRDTLSPVVLGAVRAVRLVKHVSVPARRSDVRRLLRGPLAILEPCDRLSLLRGYHGSRWTDEARQWESDLQPRTR